MRKRYAGIDGGGTKTLAIITDETGRQLGRGEAGPSNWVAVGLEMAIQNLTAALQAALADAQRTDDPTDAGADPTRGQPALTPRTCPPPLTSACFGLAGAGRPADAARLQAALAHLADRVMVTHDAAIALAGALNGQEGAILIAGTGSIAYGEAADGRSARAGGWGWILDDLGGGYDVGRRTLQAVLQAHDGRGSSTALTPLVLEHWQLAHPEELIPRVYRPQIERAEVAALALLTAQAAQAGDPAALAIWQAAGRELAQMAAAVLKRLALQSAPVATIGSLWKAGDLLRAPFQQHLSTLAPGARVTAPLAGPAAGAALLARTQ